MVHYYICRNITKKVVVDANISFHTISASYGWKYLNFTMVHCGLCIVCKMLGAGKFFPFFIRFRCLLDYSWEIMLLYPSKFQLKTLNQNPQYLISKNSNANLNTYYRIDLVIQFLTHLQTNGQSYAICYYFCCRDNRSARPFYGNVYPWGIWQVVGAALEAKETQK